MAYTEAQKSTFKKGDLEFIVKDIIPKRPYSAADFHELSLDQRVEIEDEGSDVFGYAFSAPSAQRGEKLDSQQGVLRRQWLGDVAFKTSKNRRLLCCGATELAKLPELPLGKWKLLRYL